MKMHSTAARMLALILLTACCVFAQAQTLVSGAAATGAASSVTLPFKGVKTFQVAGATSSGTGSVTVNVDGSLDGTNWDTLGTITLTLGTTSTSNGFTSNDRYTVHRANVTAISGTGASVTVRAGM